jgi:hypothetical protein
MNPHHHIIILIIISNKQIRKETYVTYLDSNLQRKVQGGKDLKGTQAYTRALGEGLCGVWQMHRQDLARTEHIQQLILEMEPFCVEEDMDWSIADLQPVIDFLEATNTNNITNRICTNWKQR